MLPILETVSFLGLEVLASKGDISNCEHWTPTNLMLCLPTYHCEYFVPSGPKGKQKQKQSYCTSTGLGI